MKLFELILLFFFHFLADFALQPSWMANAKKEDPFTLLAHSFVWTGFLTFVLIFFLDFSIWKFIFLFLGHLLCDYSKHKVYHKLPSNFKNLIDQSFHFFQLIIVCFL